MPCQDAEPHNAGRWPANVIHDGSDEVLVGFPETQSGGPNGGQRGRERCNGTPFSSGWNVGVTQGDAGSAARFFYCAKASKEDRDEGLEGLTTTQALFAEGTGLRNNGDGSLRNQLARSRNHHPTVKPTDLMRYLVRLITPPNGVCLDPFAGSGSTGKACALEGVKALLIEKELEYCELAARRSRLRQSRFDFTA